MLCRYERYCVTFLLNILWWLPRVSMVLQEVHLLGLVPPGPLQSSLALPLATVPFKFYMAATCNKLQCLSATNCNRLPRLAVCECSFPAFLNWLDSPFSFQTLFRISFLEITSLTILSPPYTPNPISHWVLLLSLHLPYLPQSVTFWIVNQRFAFVCPLQDCGLRKQGLCLAHVHF